MVWNPTFEELQEAIIAENTFGVAYVEAWAFRGACPPPLLGHPSSPTSVLISHSLRDRWSWEGPSVLVSDEEGVEIQRAAAEAAIRSELDLSVRAPGTDQLLFHWAQVALKRMGRWVEPPADHYGLFWSATRPQFWVWGAAPHKGTLLGLERGGRELSRSASPWQEIQLQRSARMFDAWLLREITRSSAA
jgi:hypothetical protein